jgi:hypothetical protein
MPNTTVEPTLDTHYEDADVAVAAAPKVFGKSFGSLHRLGKRVVCVTTDGAVYMLSGPQADRYWALLPKQA